MRIAVPRGNGLPHQCAHWFAMTHLFTQPCHFCIVRVRVPRGCGLPHQCAHWFARTRRFYAAGSFLRRAHRGATGTRIATPVCALVRNDTFIYIALSFLHLRSPTLRNGRARSLRHVVFTLCVSGCQGKTDCHTSVRTGSQGHGCFTLPCHFYTIPNSSLLIPNS